MSVFLSLFPEDAKRKGRMTHPAKVAAKSQGTAKGNRLAKSTTNKE